MVEMLTTSQIFQLTVNKPNEGAYTSEWIRSATEICFCPKSAAVKEL